MSARWNPERYQQAIRFAADAHGAQTLPGSTTPYVVHLANAATEVMLAATEDPSFDASFAVQVALLHDVLEDTSTSAEVLQERFGLDAPRGGHRMVAGAYLAQCARCTGGSP
jgi:guanosine-3',5'-bis(diphosphate) 3'-pyrophosphohydrolase